MKALYLILNPRNWKRFSNLIIFKCKGTYICDFMGKYINWSPHGSYGKRVLLTIYMTTTANVWDCCSLKNAQFILQMVIALLTLLLLVWKSSDDMCRRMCGSSAKNYKDFLPHYWSTWKRGPYETMFCSPGIFNQSDILLE